MRAAPIDVVKVFSSAFMCRRKYCSEAGCFSELRCCRDNSSSMPGSSLLVLDCFSGWVRYQFAGHCDGLLPLELVISKSLKIGLQSKLQAGSTMQRRLWLHCRRKKSLAATPWALSSFLVCHGSCRGMPRLPWYWGLHPSALMPEECEFSCPYGSAFE